MKSNYFKDGLKNILISFFLMFLGPTLIFQSFKNEDHPWFEIVLSIAFIFCISAVYFGFRGLKKIVDSIFKKK